MKKIFFISLIAILFVFAGCDLLCPPEPPVVVVKYTLEASASIGGTISPSGKIEVVSGASQTFTLTPDDGFKVDFVVVTNKYGFSQNYFLTSNIYTLSNITLDGYKVKVVFKDAQLEQTLELLTQKPWKYVSYKGRTVGDLVWIPCTAETVLFGTYVFDKSYHFQSFDNNVLVGDGSYILTRDSLVIGPAPQGTGGIRNKIITLSKDTLEIRYISPYGNPLPDPSKNKEYQYKYKH